MERKIVPFSELMFKTLSSVSGLERGSELVTFRTNLGVKYEMLHESQCCEEVLVEDVCGDVEDILRSPILKVEESSFTHDKGGGDEVFEGDKGRVTFYLISTIKGSITIRWWGPYSNYSEEVSFFRRAPIEGE